MAVGETYGEWGSEEIKDKLGFVHQGLAKLSGIRNAPMPDYAFPGDNGSESMALSAAAYNSVRHIRRGSVRRPNVFRRKEDHQGLTPGLALHSNLCKQHRQTHDLQTFSSRRAPHSASAFWSSLNGAGSHPPHVNIGSIKLLY